MSGTTAMLKPKLSAVLSIPSRSFLAGKRAAIKAYPGKNNTKGSPNPILRNAGPPKKMIAYNVTESQQIYRSSLVTLILNH